MIRNTYSGNLIDESHPLMIFAVLQAVGDPHVTEDSAVVVPQITSSATPIRVNSYTATMKRLSVLLLLLASACATTAEESEPLDSTPGAVGESAETVGVAPTLTQVAEIEQPVDAASRDGDEAVYLVSRLGFVFRLIEGVVDADPVLDIADLTVAEGEQGLLGLAFSSDGKTAYLNFTDLNGDTQIISMNVDERGVFNRASMSAIIEIEQPYSNHNGGDIVVEPSGSLLVATGDGGSGGDPDRFALDDSSLLGKVLRIDPTTGEVAILARGLRNPWRIDFHDDQLWLADVGQGEWEEVSVLESVSTVSSPIDFGWSAYEGTERFNEDQTSPNHVAPLFVYEHGEDGCSISGGAIATAGALVGRYVFADYCSGRVWSIATDGSAREQLFSDIDSPVAVVRAGGSIYVLSLSGAIQRISS